MASIAGFLPGIVKIPTSAQISWFTKTWLSPRVQYSSKIVENSAQFERISQQKQTWRPPRSSSGHAIKAIVMSQNSQLEHIIPNYSWYMSFLNSHLHVQLSKWKQPNLSGSRFDMGEWFTSIDIQSLFSCSYSSTISKISEISNRKRGFPISGTPFWCRNSSPRVYSHCKRGKTHSSSQEPQNTSISGRLASSVTNRGTMSQRFGKFSEIGPKN